MGLLLSVLVTCMGVLELIEVYHRITGRAKAWVSQPTQDLIQIKRSYVKGLQNECQNVYKDIENYCRKEGIPKEDISKHFDFRFQWNDLDPNPKSLSEVCEQAQTALEFWKANHTTNQNISTEEICSRTVDSQDNLHSSFFPLTKSSSVTDVTKIGDENRSNFDLVSSTFNSPDFWRSGAILKKKFREEANSASSITHYQGQLKTTIGAASEYPTLDPKCQKYDDSDLESDSTSTISQTGSTGKDLARACITNHEDLKLDVASGHAKVLDEKQSLEDTFKQTCDDDSLLSNDVLNIVDGVKRDDKKISFRKKQTNNKSEKKIDNSLSSSKEKRNSEKNQEESHSGSEASKAFWVNEEILCYVD